MGVILLCVRPHMEGPKKARNIPFRTTFPDAPASTQSAHNLQLQAWPQLDITGRETQTDKQTNKRVVNQAAD